MTKAELLPAASPPLDWKYAPSWESTAIVSLKERYGLFIDGEFRAPLSRKYFPTINPATEEPLADVAEAGEKDVNRAVKAARAAYDDSWSSMPGKERAKYLFRIARMVQEVPELAVLETMDGGKPIKESRDVDLPLVAAHFFYYAGWADKLEYAFPGLDPKPLGVAGQVIPWNFPMMMLAWKVAPALATGNTVVLKPAETTPLSALTFAALAAEAGLPPGVLNVITGAGATGSNLVNHPDLDKVAFTGSTAVGKLIRNSLAGTGKKVTLELGGKAAHVIFDDAPMDQAIEGVINGIFFNQGHVCCAGSRLFVQESIHDRFVDKLKRRLSTLRVGDPLDKNTDVGAINSAEQLARISELVDAGRAEGAEMFQPDCVLPRNGFWFRPTLFTGVSQSHRIAQEEIFGPVLSIMSFRTPEEAIEKANNTPYGLSAGVWTSKGSRILWMADRLQAGVVWANTYNKFDPASPFGGYKESGFGREGGRHGLLAYLEGISWSRLDVRKTYKLYINGEFPRSESGRTYPALDEDGEVLARVALGSRKDLREAVRAARTAQPKWAERSGYNRGQILYRMAEIMEDRRAAFEEQLGNGGATAARTRTEVANSIDRMVWYAGWADKFSQVFGNLNPVAGPFFNISAPEPTGVVGVIAPPTPSLLGLVPRLAPVIVGGNTAVVLASEPDPMPAITFAEVLDSSDVPPGVVNILTGSQSELAPWLADHMDVNAIDLAGADDQLRLRIEQGAVHNVKRLIGTDGDFDGQSPYLIAAFTETKTVWHPKGL